MSEWIELFNGKELTGWSGLDGAEHEWATAEVTPLQAADPTRFDIRPGEGLLVNGPSGRTANLISDVAHGDCELHIEFVLPKGSNSGVYFGGHYEIQVFDSWGAEEVTYQSCGGIYCQWIDGQPVGGTAPNVNASRPPGEWQTYDVIFRAPRFDDTGRKTSDALFESVIWNDQVVHENVSVGGPTRAAVSGPERPAGPLMLQGDHGPVAYRNIRIKLLT